mgnify:FL=1
MTAERHRVTQHSNTFGTPGRYVQAQCTSADVCLVAAATTEWEVTDLSLA